MVALSVSMREIALRSVVEIVDRKPIWPHSYADATGAYSRVGIGGSVGVASGEITVGVQAGVLEGVGIVGFQVGVGLGVVVGMMTGVDVEPGVQVALGV